MMNKIKICLSVSLCAACVAWVSAEDWPFVPDAPMSWDETLHVAGDAGSDEEGSSTLKTITEALDRALPLLEAGRSVHIVIQPGVYKETLAFDVSGGSETLRLTPLRIEGADDGVIVSGLSEHPFDAVWEPVPDQEDIYMADWPYPFHLEVGPWTPNGKPLPGLVARSEAMARLSGKTLHPRELERFTWEGREAGQWVFNGMNGFGVLERPDTFAVALSPDAPDALRGKVFVRTEPGAGADSLQDIILPRRLWSQARFDWGTLASFVGKHNLTLRKLTFQHAGTHLIGPGLAVKDGERILIEDCRVVNNAGMGLGLNNNRKVIVRRSDLSGNGYNGIKARSHEILFEDVDLVGNNWRSTYAGWVNWDSAAVKLGGSSGDVIFRRCTAVNNADHGFWSDGWHKNILFESCVAWGNKGRGFFLEYTGPNGPIRVERSISAFNDYGVYISSVRKPAVLDSILFRNAMSELLFAEWKNRTPTTAEGIVLVDISGNHIENSQNGLLIDTVGELVPDGEKIAPALLFSNNLYVASSGNPLFKPSGKLLNFTGWQNWLEQNGAKAPHDSDSSFHLAGSEATITPEALQAQAADILGRPLFGLVAIRVPGLDGTGTFHLEIPTGSSGADIYRSIDLKTWTLRSSEIFAGTYNDTTATNLTRGFYRLVPGRSPAPALSP